MLSWARLPEPGATTVAGRRGRAAFSTLLTDPVSRLIELQNQSFHVLLFSGLIAVAAGPLLSAGFGQVELFALLGMPVYVCATGATPLIAILIYKGVSPGAALAFLLTCPATNVTTFGILTQLHGRRIALAFGAGIACLAVVAGHVVNALGPALPGTPLSHAHFSSTGLQEISLGVLALIVAASLLRRGPRGFVGQLFASGGGQVHPESAGHAASPDASDCCAGEDAAPSSEESDCCARADAGHTPPAVEEQNCCSHENVVSSPPAAEGNDCCASGNRAAPSAEARPEPAPVPG